jgi:hypothetical protein
MAVRSFTAEELVAAAGGVVAVVAAFLPWVVAEVTFGPISAGGSPLGIEGLGAVPLALGPAVVGVVFALDLVEQGAVLTALAGAGIALVAGYRYVDLSDLTTPGTGLYLTLVTGVVVAAAGGAGLRD